ncbi:class IV lanthionine synthetase LanL [Streptomyces sp. NPDC056480]|uniref:class IV lanthionine synthetase LanL n=1 Tax=Streptomyces sp. NPDC056480 TaxID=3345833 RepID=UPI0036A3FE27
MTGNERSRAGAPKTMADSVLLIDVIRAVLDRCNGQRWSIRPDEAWCYLSPPEGHNREHGWKLHVTATPLSAPLVLARAGEVLVRAGCAFKFGTDMRRVSQLVDQWYARGGGGKFITVYPKDDDQFRELAEQLHRVTEGLPGPGILSDKRLRPGSLVFYRYGEIGGSGHSDFTDDGTFQRRMVGPDGTSVADERNAWFSPPPWASSPFPDDVIETPQTPDSVLLAGRYRVTAAIRHANKGGVYRAVDEVDGAEVVIKQARAHVGSGLDGTDVRDRLRQEDRILQELQPLRVAPARVGLMDEQGDLFLIQEQVPGQTLQDWSMKRATEDPCISSEEALDMSSRLVELVQEIHEAGYVIRDLKPANIMVLPEGDLRIIDVEYVTRCDTMCRPIGTPGFMAPELEHGDAAMEAGTPADCYSLGATLFHMITALVPTWLNRRDDGQDVGEILARISGSHPVLSSFIGLIIGLTQTDLQERWTLAQARDWITALADGDTSLETPAVLEMSLSDERLEELINERIQLLQSSMTPDAAKLWKMSQESGEERDPCAAWNGAAGGLAVLTTAATHVSGGLRETVADAAAWINQRLFSIPRLLPGLAFGRAGTAWALHDAGQLLGNAELKERAIDLAAKLPTEWPIADITHGLSGAGMANLHLWQATGDPRPLKHALACADSVLAAAQRDGDDWSWPIPKDVDSILAGVNVYGFAHGIAGAGAFMLAIAQAAEAHAPGSGSRFYEAALGAGETLTRVAVRRETGAVWPRSAAARQTPVDDTVKPVHGMYWCGGVGGIGSFLVRLGAATHEQRFVDLAEQAAAEAARNPWDAPPGACCGLAGVGHFFLDMAHYTGKDSYHHQARTIAAIIDARTVVNARGHRHKEESLDYQGGVAGMLSFFLRLRHGGSPPWTPEQVNASR